ncbi:DHCR24 [Lepeophtheirus salmonis]|uniref:DHCR24 n=1 Tax=Lepeophtheirus salmonis TaxID=72036 RepID=A0A7R8H1Y6_LEPSM|nr:DHCR24 [Lepeophtheirus salmonis]CAF2803622.1 DHCR24 [Lepeophtheirus salmonis]
MISFFKFLKLINSIIGYSNASHEEKLKDVQRQVRHRLDTGDKRPMCTARPGYKSITLQQITYKETCYKININMSNVIDLDTKNQRVLVEPMIDIGTLNDYLISQGWTLPVVPELDELTIGGLVMGGGIETTSNKYGLFQYICTMYELLTYIPTGSIKEFIHEFEKIVNDETIDSIEGIVYSFDKAILMKGEFVDESVRSSYPVNSIGRWYKEWFYTHVEKYTLGWTLPPKFSFLKFLRHRFVPPGEIDNFICQDFGFELDNLEDALRFVDEQCKVYPLWICPTRHLIPKHLEDYSQFHKDTIHIDVGIYGFSPIPNLKQAVTQKAFEKYCLETGSLVALYAETQLTYEEFHTMFAKTMENYYKLRKRYNFDDAFPTVYEKVSKLGRSPNT